jgi:hypothetical protein
MYIDVRCIMNDVLFYDGINDGVNVFILFFIVIMFGYVILMLYVCIMIK